MFIYDAENRFGSGSRLYCFQLWTPNPTEILKVPRHKNSVRDRDEAAPKLVFSGHSNEKTEKETSPDALIMDNLLTSLATTVDKSHVNTIGSIVERFIKPRASTMFGYPVYSLDGPGP